LPSACTYLEGTCEEGALKQRLGFRAEDRLILFVGRLEEGKGLEDLLRAMPQVLLEVPQARLVVVGGGNYDDYLPLTKNLWGRVLFTGYLPQEELQMLYRAAEVGVLSSLSEQSSMVALEMMSHALGLVCSDIGAF